LFEKAYYHKDEYGKPIIELTCTETSKDLFFCIGKYHYFKYALENVINLTRKASYLLYLHILTNRFRGEWELLLDELRDEVLDCKEQESYQEYKIFKNRVLDPAVKEVNEKTDCHFEYEAIKRGRRVAKIKFTYIPETVPAIDTQPTLFELSDGIENEGQDEYSTDWDEVYGSEQLATLAFGCHYEFNKNEMEQIFFVLTRINIPEDPMTKDLTFGRMSYLQEKYAALNVEVAKKASKGEKPIRNRFKYFLSMLEKDTFQPAAY
ncbi:MAG: replication initiation protein, partial [Acutalibacteraceae bacterium]|nr:replication initiation protein [Acutalibacteraceae bacterium]